MNGWSDDLIRSSRPSVVSAASAGGFSSALAGLLVVVLLAAVAVPAAALARGGRSFWPARWDARIAPIAARDEQLRSLNYLHPVPVQFLSDKAFVKELDAQNGDLRRVGQSRDPA